MTTETCVPSYRSSLAPNARDGFGQLLLAEWTKLRTVGRWRLTLLAAVVLAVLISVKAASGGSGPANEGGDGEGPAPTGPGGGGPAPTGPDGRVIRDDFHFVHQTLTGDGGITARVSGLTGERPDENPAPCSSPPSTGAA
ncbi:hypothetical protein U9R90_07085 [Streptomyces sp. E11-3]|uniref:hypothetical protein n=1 Tax=Streptomyces sp. E11-3 TaxID=3110112 RepID=UPI00397F2524